MTRKKAEHWPPRGEGDRVFLPLGTQLKKQEANDVKGTEPGEQKGVVAPVKSVKRGGIAKEKRIG